MVAFTSKPILSPGSLCLFVSGIVVYYKYVICGELLHIMSYTLHTYNGYVGHVCGHMIGGHTADKERK